MIPFFQLVQAYTTGRISNLSKFDDFSLADIRSTDFLYNYEFEGNYFLGDRIRGYIGVPGGVRKYNPVTREISTIFDFDNPPLPDRPAGTALPESASGASSDRTASANDSHGPGSTPRRGGAGPLSRAHRKGFSDGDPLTSDPKERTHTAGRGQKARTAPGGLPSEVEQVMHATGEKKNGLEDSGPKVGGPNRPDGQAPRDQAPRPAGEPPAATQVESSINNSQIPMGYVRITGLSGRNPGEMVNEIAHQIPVPPELTDLVCASDRRRFINSPESDYYSGVQLDPSVPQSYGQYIADRLRINVQIGATDYSPGSPPMQGDTLVVGGDRTRLDGTYRPAKDGEVYLDINPQVNPDIVADIRHKNGIPDQSFDRVTFENVNYDGITPDSIGEAWRILRDNGHIQISIGPGAMVYDMLRNLRTAGFKNIRILSAGSESGGGQTLNARKRIGGADAAPHRPEPQATGPSARNQAGSPDANPAGRSPDYDVAVEILHAAGLSDLPEQVIAEVAERMTDPTPPSGKPFNGPTMMADGLPPENAPAEPNGPRDNGPTAGDPNLPDRQATGPSARDQAGSQDPVAAAKAHLETAGRIYDKAREKLKEDAAGSVEKGDRKDIVKIREEQLREAEAAIQRLERYPAASYARDSSGKSAYSIALTRLLDAQTENQRPVTRRDVAELRREEYMAARERLQTAQRDANGQAKAALRDDPKGLVSEGDRTDVQEAREQRLQEAETRYQRLLNGPVEDALLFDDQGVTAIERADLERNHAQKQIETRVSRQEVADLKDEELRIAQEGLQAAQDAAAEVTPPAQEGRVSPGPEARPADEPSAATQANRPTAGIDPVAAALERLSTAEEALQRAEQARGSEMPHLFREPGSAPVPINPGRPNIGIPPVRTRNTPTPPTTIPRFEEAGGVVESEVPPSVLDARMQEERAAARARLERAQKALSEAENTDPQAQVDPAIEAATRPTFDTLRPLTRLDADLLNARREFEADPFGPVALRDAAAVRNWRRAGGQITRADVLAMRTDRFNSALVNRPPRPEEFWPKPEKVKEITPRYSRLERTSLRMERLPHGIKQIIPQRIRQKLDPDYRSFTEDTYARLYNAADPALQDRLPAPGTFKPDANTPYIAGIPRGIADWSADGHGHGLDYGQRQGVNPYTAANDYLGLYAFIQLGGLPQWVLGAPHYSGVNPTPATLRFAPLHDRAMIRKYNSLVEENPAMAAQVVPYLTGHDFSEQTKQNPVDYTRDAMLRYPEIFHGVGEVTANKELVSRQQGPWTWDVDSSLFEQFLEFANETGLAVILHNDGGRHGLEPRGPSRGQENRLRELPPYDRRIRTARQRRAAAIPRPKYPNRAYQPRPVRPPG